MRYYIIAGERSGDLHASNLVKEIRKRDGEAVFRGLGGAYLRTAGVSLFADYAEFAVMGFLEVLGNLRKISGYINKTVADLRAFQADVVILVDYGGFNMRVARKCKAAGIRVFYYIPPKVWAWNQGRAKKLKATVDELFVILPFEKDFFRKFDMDVHYVGNPVLDAVKAHTSNPEFRRRFGLSDNDTVIALLPGSRKQELLRILPLMREVVTRFPDWKFGVATVSNLDSSLYAPLKGLSNTFFVEEDTYNLLGNANAAIVTSGTATLETALFEVPQVVVYKTSGFSYAVAKRLIRVPYISLVNLIAGKEVVRELIQGDARGEATAIELNRLVDDAEYRQEMLMDYERITRILDTGSASENAARQMVRILQG
jgi:lipid-A-disaccharide synthase